MDPITIILPAIAGLIYFGLWRHVRHDPRRVLERVARDNNWSLSDGSNTAVVADFGDGGHAIAQTLPVPAYSGGVTQTGSRLNVESSIGLPPSYVRAHGQELGAWFRSATTAASAFIADGALRHQSTDYTSKKGLELRLRSMANATRTLHGGLSPRDAVRELVRSGPSEGLRRTALAWLLEHDPDYGELPRLVEDASGAFDPMMRLVAARGQRGAAAIETLLSVLVDRYAPDQPRLNALNRILESPAFGSLATAERQRIEGALLDVVNIGSGQLLVQALGALGSVFDRDVEVDWLRARLTAVGPLARIALIAALQRHGERVEPLLLGRLDDDDLIVCVAAVNALERCGTPLSLARLDRLARRRGLPEAAKRSVQAALSAVHARYPHASSGAGGLAISGELADTKGQLSEASEEGELSFSD